MALRVWLPLNGTLENKGISNFSIAGTPTYYASGKLGQAFKCQGSTNIDFTVPELVGVKKYSICLWIYMESQSAQNGNWLACFRAYTQSGTIFYCSGTPSNSTNVVIFGNNEKDMWSGNMSRAILDGWHHTTITSDGSKVILYIDGVEVQSNITANDGSLTGRIMLLNGSYAYLNDLRIYDHCLSPLEVKEISQGLILHYKLDGWSGGSVENLMLGTLMTQTPIGTSTDYTNLTHIRYYNTSASNCTILNNEATILLNSTSNLGISFERLASEINFDTSSYYTLSCEAKTTLSGAQLSIGTSYYKTDDTAVWRGGSNKKAFNSLNSWQTFTLTFKPDTDIKAICYCFTVNGTSGGTETATIRHCKLEKGSTATTWSPAPADLGIDTNKIVDSSGYGNDGNVVDVTTEQISPDGRYSICTNMLGTTVDSSSNTITGAQYLYSNFAYPATSAITYAWWGNNIAYGRGGILETTATTGNIWEGSDYSTTAIANWDSTFGIYNGTTRVNIYSVFPKTDATWHHHAIVFNGTNVIYYKDGVAAQTSALTGTLPAITGFKIGLGRAGGVYRQIKQKMSDFRIYATALSADDILTLYHTPANIDNLGGLHAFEFVENDEKDSIYKNGIVSNGENINYLINNFAETNTMTDWTFGGTSPSISGGVVTLTGTSPNVSSKTFTVNPDDIIVIEIGVQLTQASTTTSGPGIYLGTKYGQSTSLFSYNFTTNKWVAGSTSNTNPYFINSYNDINYYHCKTYLLGSNKTIDDIPDAKATNTRTLYAIKLNSETTTNIRSGYNSNTEMIIKLSDFKIYNLNQHGIAQVDSSAKTGYGYLQYNNFIEK